MKICFYKLQVLSKAKTVRKETTQRMLSQDGAQHIASILQAKKSETL